MQKPTNQRTMCKNLKQNQSHFIKAFKHVGGENEAKHHLKSWKASKIYVIHEKSKKAELH